MRLARALLCLGLALFLGGAITADRQRRAPITAGGVDLNSAPGTQSIFIDTNTDDVTATTGAAQAIGMAWCVYWEFAANPGDVAGPLLGLWDTGDIEEMTSLSHYTSDGAWTGRLAHIYPGDSASDVTAVYTGALTNDWVLCGYAPDGTGETAGTRLLLYENVSGTWTSRADAGSTAVVEGVASARWAIGHIISSTTDGAVQHYFKYVWVRKEWPGVSYNSATVLTNFEELMNCSVDPADTDFLQIWGMNETSTTAETAVKGTNLAMTGITRVSGDPLWSGFGSDTGVECDE